MLSEKEIAEITERRLDTTSLLISLSSAEELREGLRSSDRDIAALLADTKDQDKLIEGFCNTIDGMTTEAAEKDKIIEGLENTIREVYKLTNHKDENATGWGIVVAIKQWCEPVMFSLRVLSLSQPKTEEG